MKRVLFTLLCQELKVRPFRIKTLIVTNPVSWGAKGLNDDDDDESGFMKDGFLDQKISG